jgi:cysteine-rich repeat protein
MKRLMTLALLCLSTLALLCLLAVEASANHLHFVPISDARYSPQTLDQVFPGSPPLLKWIIYSGDDSNVTIDGNTYSESTGTGTVKAVFDAPKSEDVTLPQATALFEFEVLALDTSGTETMQVGLTDLINDIEWDEAGQDITGTKNDGSNTPTQNVSRWSDLGNLPLRVQLYYHFADFVFTAVVLDESGAELGRFSFPDVANPFDNFFGIVGGTDPDNLDIYPYVFCRAHCSVQTLAWDDMVCDTVSGEVDVDNCRVRGVGDGIIEPGETCDDGNTVSGDGCDENGQLENTGRRCQEAIGKAGEKYVRDRLKNLQKCRNLLNKGATLFQDRAETVAITDRSECPNAFRTARTLARTRERVRKLVAAKCTDALVGALGTCGETVDELVSPDGTAGCLIDTHDAAVAALLTAQYGG